MGFEVAEKVSLRGKIQKHLKSFLMKKKNTKNKNSSKVKISKKKKKKMFTTQKISL